MAMVLDCFVQGRVARAGDILCQRFRALECSMEQGSWTQASLLELIPPENAGLLTEAEQKTLMKKELLQRKLTEARDKAKSGRHG